MLTAIIFDYNGVLVDDLSIHEDAYLYAAETHGFPLTRALVHDHISHAPDKKRHLYFGDISDGMWAQIQSTKNGYYARRVQEKDLLFPHAESVLSSLSGTYRLALLSNTSRNDFNRVFPGNLSMLFEETLFAEEVDHPKPDPDPLLRIIRRLMVSKKRCCYVGDSVLDIHMSKAAGIPGYGVATGHSTTDELKRAGALDVATSLTDLKKKLNPAYINRSQTDPI